MRNVSTSASRSPATGGPAVVVISADEWESLQETLFWLSQPGIHQDLAAAEHRYEAGTSFDEAQVRQKLGLKPRP